MYSFNISFILIALGYVLKTGDFKKRDFITINQIYKHYG